MSEKTSKALKDWQESMRNSHMEIEIDIDRLRELIKSEAKGKVRIPAIIYQVANKDE